MNKYWLTLLTILVSINLSQAQSDSCPCCTENHMAFDFWVGDWTVFNTAGDIIGTNNIIKMEDGCVLQENWKSSDKSNTGTSYNFFDSTDQTWNQVWISNSGNILRLKGNVNHEGMMILKSDLVKGKNGNYYNQITWSKDSDGSVIQRWDILNEQGESISSAFEGIYRVQSSSKKN